MYRISLNYLAAPLLTLLGTVASGVLHAQQAPTSHLPALTLPHPPGTPLHPAIACAERCGDSATAFLVAPLFSSGSAAAGPFADPIADAVAGADPEHPGRQRAAAPPDATSPPPQTDALTPRQSKRVLGVIPNFRSVGTSAKLPPQSVREKFMGATQDSFDYSSVIIPALLALYGYESHSVPQFGTGGVAFGRYLWHTTVDQTTENYMVEFFVPVATHEDTRYYTLGHGGFFKRTGYALSRIVVTRSDSARETFNISEIVGAGASAGMSNLYYPRSQRNLSTTANNWGLDMGLDASTFVLREFWPDIDHRLFHDR